MRVYTGLRRRSARFQRLAAILYRYIGEETWNQHPSSKHHDQAVMLTGYACLYDHMTTWQMPLIVPLSSRIPHVLFLPT